MPMSVDIETFRALEEGMWRPETRSDPAHLDNTLAEGFSDFCRFGHVYDRADLIDAPSSDVEVDFPLEDFEVELLAPTVALVTYVNTIMKNGKRERARRSSIWVSEDDSWRLRHVQATTLL